MCCNEVDDGKDKSLELTSYIDESVLETPLPALHPVKKRARPESAAAPAPREAAKKSKKENVRPAEVRAPVARAVMGL